MSDTMTVCTIQLPAEELHEGSIVVSGGRAHYLTRNLGSFMGYQRWEYVRRNPDGSTAAAGVANYRDGSRVPVVAVTLDGAVVTVA